MGKHAKPTTKRKSPQLVTLGMCALLSIGGVSTVAAFSDTATSAVTVSAGSVKLTAGGAESFALDFGTGWYPGRTANKNVILKNAGTLPLKYTMDITGTPGTLSKKLDAKVTAKNAAGTVTTLFTGKLNLLGTTTGRSLAVGVSETINLTLTWPAGTDDNTYQSASGNSTITFTATQ